MQKSFKEVKYRIMFPTDVSPNIVSDLLAKEFNIEKFEKEEEIIIFVEHVEKTKKKPVTGTYKGERLKGDKIGG